MKYFILFVFMSFGLYVSGQKTWKFEDFRKTFIKTNDTVYVVNFWATWCLPCVKELPYFEKSIENFSNKPVTFYFLSLDFGDNAWQKANAFLDKKNYSFDSYLTTDEDSNEWIPKVDPAWSGAIPATVFYYGDRKIFHEGKISESKLNKYINRLLN